MGEPGEHLVRGCLGRQGADGGILQRRCSVGWVQKAAGGDRQALLGLEVQLRGEVRLVSRGALTRQGWDIDPWLAALCMPQFHGRASYKLDWLDILSRAFKLGFAFGI